MPPVTTTLIQENHARKAWEVQVIKANIMEEVALGWMFGPLSAAETQTLLGSPFRTSPMGLVPKAGSRDKYRVIRDFSYKGNAPSSVNGYIPEDRRTRWVGFDEFADKVSPNAHTSSPSQAPQPVPPSLQTVPAPASQSPSASLVLALDPEPVASIYASNGIPAIDRNCQSASPAQIESSTHPVTSLSGRILRDIQGQA
jgi:hypothetical protein